MKCLNCDNEFEGAYCPVCGQRSRVKKLGMGDFFREIPASILNLERRFWNTVRDVAKNPFKMTKAFSEGKRKYYAPPIQFFFFFATISFFLRKIFVKVQPNLAPPISVAGGANNMGEAVNIVDRLKFGVEQYLTFAENFTNYFELGTPLLFGLFLFLFVRKRFNLAESITFSFFVFSLAIYVPFLLLFPFSGIWDSALVQGLLNVFMVAWACSYLGKRRILNALLGIFLYFFTLSVYVFLFILISAFFY